MTSNSSTVIKDVIKERERAPGESRPRAVARVVEHEVEEDLVLYDPSRDAVHILNTTASVVWWLCDGQRTHEEIVARVADLYGVEPAAVAGDVQEVLCRLRDAGVVERS